MTYILDTVCFIRLDQVYYVFLSLDLVHNGHILMSAPVLRIQDVYPSSRILIFPYPGCRIQKQQQKWWVKKSCCHTFLHSHIFLKIENDFSFEELKKKFYAIFKEFSESATLLNV